MLSAQLSMSHATLYVMRNSLCHAVLYAAERAAKSFQ